MYFLALQEYHILFFPRSIRCSTSDVKKIGSSAMKGIRRSIVLIVTLTLTLTLAVATAVDKL